MKFLKNKLKKIKRPPQKSGQSPKKLDPIEGEQHILFQKNITKGGLSVKQFTIYLSAFDETPLVISKFIEMLSEVQPEDLIRVVIDSDGGLVNEGKAIINAIYDTGAEVHTVIQARAYSMGSVLFCIGDKRIVYENSSLMYHNFSAGSYGKGHEIQEHVDFLNNSLKPFFKGFLLGLSKKEFNKMFHGKDYWFNAEEMCRRKIATHVSLGGILLKASDYLKILKRTRKEAKKHGLKIETIKEGLQYDIDYVSEHVEEEFLRQERIQQEILALSERLEYDDV